MVRIVTGQKVAGDDFYDRRGLLEQIWTILPKHSVELVAPRRFGKTSVMQRLIDKPQHNSCVVAIDCEHFQQPSEFADAVVDSIMRSTLRP